MVAAPSHLEHLLLLGRAAKATKLFDEVPDSALSTVVQIVVDQRSGVTGQPL
jgi:hypothetical protein